MNTATQYIYDLISAKGLFMLGAKNLSHSNAENFVQFRIRGSKAFNHIKIQYNAGADLFHVTFTKIWGGEVKHAKTYHGVYVDMVRSLITDETGLYLSL